MKAWHFRLPVNVRLQYDLTSISDFGDEDELPVVTLVDSGECVAIMAVLTEGISEDEAHVIREIMDWAYMLGRFDESLESDHATVWVKLTDKTGYVFEADFDQLSNVHQVAVVEGLKELFTMDGAGGTRNA